MLGDVVAHKRTGKEYRVLGMSQMRLGEVWFDAVTYISLDHRQAIFTASVLKFLEKFEWV